jgi:glycosyltransferase involved in cell wall biosynthesis
MAMRLRGPHRRNLLVVTNWRDRKHPHAGGAELVCERLARAFCERGHDVVLLTSAVAGERRKEQRDGYWIVRRGGRWSVYLWVLAWMLLYRKYIRGVVDSQNGIPFFTPLVVKRKTPVLMLLHHVHQDQFHLYFPPAVAKLGQWAERFGSGLVYRDRTIIAVSPSTRKGVRRRLGLKGDIVVIPPGSDTAVSSLPGIRGRSNAPRIVSVGRLVPHKGMHSIVEGMPAVLSAHPEAELHLVGDGPERRTLQALVERLDIGARVTLHGALGAAERDELMRTAWMSVNASAGEGWGISVIEANAFGIPVLAYRRAGLQDSIRDGETGWLIDADEELGPAMARLLDEMGDQGAAAAMGKRARQWASQFTWDEMADQALALMEAEAGRLAHSPDNRRTFTDLATVVRIPLDLFPDGVAPVFRATDKCVMSGRELVVLLRNTDTETARVALRRAGVSPSAVEDERVQITVARPVDLVSPAVSAEPVLRIAAERHDHALAG